MLEDIYQEIILDHHKHPRCRGALDGPCATHEVYNPLCGDRIVVEVKGAKGEVHKLAFAGSGCAISQASASMLCELCAGKPIAEIRTLENSFRSLIKGETTAEDCEELGDATALEGVSKYPNRIKCALIAWDALNRCLDDIEKE